MPGYYITLYPSYTSVAAISCRDLLWCMEVWRTRHWPSRCPPPLRSVTLSASSWPQLRFSVQARCWRRQLLSAKPTVSWTRELVSRHCQWCHLLKGDLDNVKTVKSLRQARGTGGWVGSKKGTQRAPFWKSVKLTSALIKFRSLDFLAASKIFILDIYLH